MQLFPTAGTKNGADIRLSVDVVEELFRLPDITHVVIVAGDSDYIPPAQNVRRLGRTVSPSASPAPPARPSRTRSTSFRTTPICRGSGRSLWRLSLSLTLSVTVLSC